MNLSRVAKAALPHWNRRVLAEWDFHKFCQSAGVRYVESATDALGEYTVYKGVPFILCDPSLRGMMRLWVMWHEAAHHLLHTPQMQLFDPGFLRKADCEANVIATVATLPKTLLKKSFGELMEEYGYPRDFLWVRKEVYERYKL